MEAAQAGTVAAALTEEIFLGIPAAGISHGRQGGLDGLEQLPGSFVIQAGDLLPGMQAAGPEQVLQDSVAQSGNALLGGQEGLQAEFLNRLCFQQ